MLILVVVNIFVVKVCLVAWSFYCINQERLWLIALFIRIVIIETYMICTKPACSLSTNALGISTYFWVRMKNSYHSPFCLI